MAVMVESTRALDALREALQEVELVTASDLARRWGITRQAVSQLMASEDAPEPVVSRPELKLWALAEAERHRSRRLLTGRRR